ncbi:tetratricopeptide repeat protein [uncultured Duncaniella sp.]|jgi:tetratricopeptide (TPR) repeat protein|uniref:tetratricopeptide repeat protein n=1 Tax=uncultured Duncaniella sp. TaxID=2768039 RepID=UPI000F4AC294|nr:tetratricopeptide repeat protein [uncultured Duncaniella sp.]ROS89834.1 tetratricopeptide repeat protein [Muribaculaceae bacterium Isolate-080 (Janvier)]
MKFRTIFSFVLGGMAMTAFAQGGYQDGVDYYNAERFDKAKTILEKTLNDPSTKKAVSYFYLGSLELDNNNVAAASENFNKGVQADPAYGYNYVGLGQIALKNGNKKDAENYFKQALEGNKKDASVMAAIARAYFNVDPTLYAKEIEKNIANAMKVSKNKEAQVYVLQGDMAKASDIGQAAGFYEQAMVYDEQAGNVNPEAYVKYANLYNKVNPDFAIGKLVELNEKLPTSALAQSELAEKYYDGNQFTKAAEQYGKYIKNPNHFQGDEQRYSGLLYFGKKYQESLDVANQVLAADPNNEYMQRMVMLNKAALKDFAGAEEAAQKLFSHANAKFTATDYSTYGDILGELGRPQDAIEAYVKAYEMNPEKNKQMLAEISSMYNDLENDQKAVEYMQKFVDAGDATLNDYFILSNRYKNLGLSLPEGSPERAEAANNGIKNIDLAIEGAANKGPLYRNKATLLMIRDGAENTTPELIDTYKAMIAAYDEDPANKEKYADAYKMAYTRMGSYYMQQGDNAQAREYFQKVLEMDPENAPVKEVMKKL